MQRIRDAGFSADMDYSGGSLKSQMRIANKRGARLVVIVGGEELSRNMVVLRNMETKEQEEVKIDNLINELNNQKEVKNAKKYRVCKGS